jgi:hypothetical protein
VKLAVVAGLAAGALLTVRAARRPAAVAATVSLASLPVLVREASRSRDPQRIWFLLALQQLHVVGALAHEYLTLRFYRGERDADTYYRDALRLARDFRRGRFDLRLARRPGIAGMRYLTAIVLTVVGRSRLAAALVFSWFGFCGLFCFYRAFVIAVPGGDARLYLALLALTPSLVFFPSSISKQAWIVFSLGLAALGSAHALTDGGRGAFALVALGLALAALVRPHIAAMFALSFAAAAFVRFGVWDERVVAGVGGGAALLLLLAGRHLRKWGIGRGDFASLLRQAGAQSSFGGSAFSPAIPRRLRDVPAAMGTVLFRPHPFEAQNVRVRAAAIESSCFSLLWLVRGRSLLRAGALSRRDPYLVLAFAFTGLFSLGYSWAANFGLLAEHRTQVLPFAFVPLAVRPS